jgi:DNA-directed RNA polymerase III subunit RPC3
VHRTEAEAYYRCQIRSATKYYPDPAVLTLVSEPISISSIAMQIPDDVDLSTGLKFPSSKTPSTMGLVKEYIALLAASDNPTAIGRAASFLSLTSSKVQVEYNIVGRRLRRRVLEAVAKERHGNEGLRIVRLLLDTGKIDEKQV